MKGFSQLVSALNWKLLIGSHEFPGPDGGTCINEAAIVAAGFEYRSVGSIQDLPYCFSPVIGGWAIELNDLFSDTDRQKLMAFVTKIAGTADTDEVELKRVKAIYSHLFDMAMDLLTSLGETEQVKELTAAKWDQDELLSLKNKYSSSCKWDAGVIALHLHSLVQSINLQCFDEETIHDFCDLLRVCMCIAQSKFSSTDFLVDWAIGSLQKACEIGKQPDDLDIGTIKKRMDAIRALKVAELVGV